MMHDYRQFSKLRFGFMALAMIFVLMTSMGCGPKKAWDPYKEKHNAGIEVPHPYNPGQPDDRWYSTKRWDQPTSTTSESFRPAYKKMVSSPGAKPSPAVGGGIDYYLGPGDVLEIIYQLKNQQRDDAYQLEVLDVVQLSFVYTPQFDRTITVRTDGKMSFPLIGDRVAAGRSIADIVEELHASYGEILRDPVIEFTVVESNRAIEELKRAITTAPRGQSRLSPIRPDGIISLPLVGDIVAAGKTVPELSEEITKRYRAARVVDVDVTVVLLEVKSAVIYVFGEVQTPGPVAMQGGIDVWRAIGSAKGFTSDADLHNIIVAKTKADGSEERHVFNYKEWNSSLDTAENIALAPGDIVYVPKAENRYVYVMGEVQNPTRIRLEPDTRLTAAQALAQGGRILSSARRTQVLVLRRSKDNEPIVIQCDFKAIARMRFHDHPYDYSPRDVVLEPGDIVYVPPSIIGDVNRFAEAWFKNGAWTILPFNTTATYSLN